MKMNLKTLFFSIFYLITLSTSAQASAIKQMYEVNLPVVTQEAQIRNAAFEQGLIEVSVRVSGTSVAPTQIDLGHASRMVRQYRYQALTQDEIDAYVKQNKSLVPPRYRLWIQFDGNKVTRLLKDNGLPIWGSQRPKVLVWLAVKDGKNRYVLKQADHSLIKDAVNNESRKRGLPIVWPKYDVQDKSAVKFIDLWGQFWEPVKKASQRYGVDAILLGRMNWTQGSWQVDWSLLLDGKTEAWRLTALDLDMLMNSGVGVATDNISSRFAVFADALNEEQLLLRITNLKTVKQYAAASHYLMSLAAVKHVHATQVTDEFIDFQVELNGDESDLKRIIALGKTLLPEAIRVPRPVPGQITNPPGNQPVQPQPPVQPANILHYRMNG